MELSTFEDLLDLHGGDLARWPSDARVAANALLAGSAEARALRDGMAEVEAVLRRSSTPVAAGGLDAIAARATRHRQETPVRRSALRASWAAAATIVLLVGLWIGAYAPVEHDASPDRVMASALGAGGAADVE